MLSADVASLRRQVPRPARSLVSRRSSDRPRSVAGPSAPLHVRGGARIGCPCRSPRARLSQPDGAVALRGRRPRRRLLALLPASRALSSSGDGEWADRLGSRVCGLDLHLLRSGDDRGAFRASPPAADRRDLRQRRMDRHSLVDRGRGRDRPGPARGPRGEGRRRPLASPARPTGPLAARAQATLRPPQASPLTRPRRKSRRSRPAGRSLRTYPGRGIAPLGTAQDRRGFGPVANPTWRCHAESAP